MEKFSEDLPPHYKTWLEFYKALEYSGLTKEYSVRTLVSPVFNIPLRDVKLRERIEEKVYLLSTIETKLREELYDNRKNIQGFTFKEMYSLLNMAHETKLLNPDLTEKIRKAVDFLYETKYS